MKRYEVYLQTGERKDGPYVEWHTDNEAAAKACTLFFEGTGVYVDRVRFDGDKLTVYAHRNAPSGNKASIQRDDGQYLVSVSLHSEPCFRPHAHIALKLDEASNLPGLLRWLESEGHKCQILAPRQILPVCAS